MTRETQTHTGLHVLLEMLTRMRPAGSKTERRFIREYIAPLGVTVDRAGNQIKQIGDRPQVMWSCHTDTVHRQGGNQLVTVTSGIAHLDTRSKSNCLGADDTVGVWLMCEMIRAGVPGLYVFHRGEEIGGVGSSHIAYRFPELLKDVKCAIALDRKGKSSVITHQGSRCASDAFANSLASALADVGLPHFKPDDGGVFTDTANYVDLVGECTNLSVGYERQHSALETLDLSFALALRDALIALDTSRLVIQRKPGEVDPADAFYFSKGGGYGMAYGAWDDADVTPDKPTILELVRRYPDEIASILEEFGYDGTTLERVLWDMGAPIFK